MNPDGVTSERERADPDPPIAAGPDLEKVGRSRRFWVAVVGIAGLALAVAAGGALWERTAESTADAVQVYWKGGGPQCTGTSDRRDRDSGQLVVEAVPGMRCTYRVVISNTSGRTVHLNRLVGAFIGPETGGVLTADTGTDPAPRPASYGIDASYLLDRELRAGDEVTVDVVVVFNPAGCSQGGTAWVRPWPVVSLEAMHRTFERGADQSFAWHHVGKTPGCQDIQ